MEVLVGPSLRIDQVRSGSGSDFEEDDSSDSSIGAPDDSSEEEEEQEQEQEEEKEEEGAVSSERAKFKGASGSLGSLASLEDSLPIKRGLSLHISGKSKSFTNLAEAHIGTVKDLEKKEHPFNKKRRMLRWSRNNLSGYYKWSNPRSMPVLPVIEDDDDDEEEEEEEGGGRGGDRTEPGSSDADPSSPGIKLKQRHRVLKSRSCFDLAELPEEEDDDD